MNAIRTFRALGPMDLHSLRRDQMLRFMIFIPVIVALVLRWGVPLLSAFLLVQFQFDLHPYYPLMMGFVFPAMPMIIGMVIGFLLLDQRDDQTLTALQVTPMTMSSYLLYRIGVPLVLTTLINGLVLPLSNLVPLGWEVYLVSALSAAPFAPLSALFFASVAQNKVQGFAVSKLTGIILIPAIVAWFIPGAWQYAFGLVPTYWTAKCLWMAAAGQAGWWIPALIGIIYQAGLTVLLQYRFQAILRRG